MNKCKNCESFCIFGKPTFTIRKINGSVIYVNPKMYCSKECFVMKNILNNNYDCLYSSDDENLEYGNVQRSRNLCLRVDENKSKKEKTN